MEQNDPPSNEFSTEGTVVPFDATAPFESAGPGLGEETTPAGGGGIVTARGTVDGLVLRIDGRAGDLSIINAAREFVESRRKFLFGNEIALEWLGMPARAGVEERLRSLLAEEFNIKFRPFVADATKKNSSVEMSAPFSSRSSAENIDYSFDQDRGSVHDRTAGAGQTGSIQKTDRAPAKLASSITSTSILPNISTFKRKTMGHESDESSSLFGGVESFPESHHTVGTWDEPNARVTVATLRSGQKIESEHSVIVLGDVNSGAEIISGGDVIVLGSLRGVAHAGAYDETGGGRVIIALSLQPTQLRIGSIISRGGADSGKNSVAELARVDGTGIVVEPYSVKGLLGLRRDFG